MSLFKMRLPSMIAALSNRGIHNFSSIVLVVVLVTISNAIPVGKIDYSNSTQTFDNGTLTYRDCFDDRGGGTFRSGDLVPRFGPCEECRCLDGEVVCSMVQCEVKPGCKTIQRRNQCCPDYKCECEHNGQVYNNGERLNSSLTPCQVCYCRGGALMCTLFTCYTRDDCEGRTLPGTCCPSYHHCPPLDLSRRGDDPTRNTKREMQPWFMSSPTQPSFTSSTVESNMTTPFHNEQDTTDAIIFTNADYADQLFKTTELVNDAEADYSTIVEQTVSTTEEVEKRLLDPSNVTDQSFENYDKNESSEALNTSNDSIDNNTDISGIIINNTLENNETHDDGKTDNIDDTHLGILVDQSKKYTVDINSVSPTESYSKKVAVQSLEEQDMATSNLHLINEIKDVKSATLNSAANIKTDDFSTLPTSELPQMNGKTTTKELQTENSSLKSEDNENTPYADDVTPIIKYRTSSSINNPSADSIIEKLTNITNSFMDRSELENEHRNTGLALERIADTDIMIQTNRKLESTEKILILDRSKNPLNNHQNKEFINKGGTKLINNNQDGIQNVLKKPGNVMKIDYDSVTLPPDVMDNILKLSRILLDNDEQKPISSVSESSQKKEAVAVHKNVEPAIGTNKDNNGPAMGEKIVEKRNATSDTNTTLSIKEEPEEIKNPDSTGGSLDAQTQQDLLASSADAGKNSEYKLEHFELTESDPVSTFKVDPGEILVENSTDNSHIVEGTTEFPIFNNDKNDVETSDKESLSLDESSTNSYTSTEKMSIEETTLFQTEKTTTTPFKDGESTTENCAPQSTTTQSESLETTTEFLITTTEVYYDVTTNEIMTTNTESFTETTDPTEITKSTTKNNEWKIEILTDQKKKNENTDVKVETDEKITDISYNRTEFPEMRHPNVRDQSSSEESSFKSDNSGESGQEIPGFLLNDQFSYLELGGFHISTETKSKNKTNFGLMQDLRGKNNSVTNNKIIQELIKDNQHLIIINQDSPSDSKEEDRIDKFASVLEKILNEEPTLKEEATPIENFQHKNINNIFEGFVKRKYQRIESHANHLDPVTESVFDEDTTEDSISTATPTNTHFHSELFKSLESEPIQPPEPCLECSVLKVDTGITKTDNIVPIKFADYNGENTHFKEETEQFINEQSKANIKLPKMFRINDRNKVFSENTQGNSNLEDSKQIQNALYIENHRLHEAPIQDDRGYQVHEENEEFTLESPQSLFEIKSERIDEQGEGRLFYDSEKFKKPPEIVYPEEYPEEFIYINSPPLLIVTSTVYTSVPDVMFITTQTTNLGLSYDYLTEEYKGDIFEKRTSEDGQKVLKSESRDSESPEFVGQTNETLTVSDDKRELNSSKISHFKDILPHRISLLNESDENIQYKNNTVGPKTIERNLNESSETLHNGHSASQITHTIGIQPTKVSENGTSQSTNSLIKMAKNKRRRENQKLLRELEETSPTFTSHQLKKEPERAVNPISRNNARRMIVDEKDAEWIIPVKPKEELTHVVNKVTENPDAEWIVPENKRNRPQGRHISMEENRDAEWITPQSHTNIVTNRKTTREQAEQIMPLNEKQGRQIPMEKERDAEWITPQIQSNKKGNADKRTMMDRNGKGWEPSHGNQGKQLPVEEEKEAEWITPKSSGQEIGSSFNRGRTRSFSNDDPREGSSSRQFPMQEVDAEWITTKKTTRT